MDYNDLETLNQRHVRARIHIENDDDFIHDVVLDRNPAEYPDPYLREVTDPDLLSQYISRVRSAILSYNPSTQEEQRTCREFLRREHTRVSSEYAYFTTPTPREYGIPTNIVDTLEEHSLSTGYLLGNRSIPWDAYHNLFTRPLDELRYLSAYYKMKEKPFVKRGVHKENVRILNAIRYFRNDPTVSIDNIVTFVPIEQVRDDLVIEIDGEQIELIEGVSFETIKQELRRLPDRFSSLPVALAFANIGKITNYHHPALANGLYDSIETNISEQIGDDDVIPRNVVLHEFFHSLQDIIGTRDFIAKGQPVEFDQSPAEWDPVVFPTVQPSLSSIQEETKQLWFQFRNGNIDPLCRYQTKNIDEMYAVAFEAYMESPTMLKEKQPAVYALLKRILSGTWG